MTIESIRSILQSLESSLAWQPQSEFEHLTQCWLAVVGATVSQHSRPLELRHGVLKVTTSNSVWAQQLRFESPRILAQLNRQLPQPIREIRFSPAQWHQPPVLGREALSLTPPLHPSRRSPQTETHLKSVPRLTRNSQNSIGITAQAAFQQWVNQVQTRSQGLPLCPHCQSPTLPGELQHWSVCALCAIKLQKPSC